MTLTLEQHKGLTTRNTHGKYLSSIIFHSTVMANVKAFCGKCDFYLDLDLDRWYHKKVDFLSLTIQKLWPMSEFFADKRTKRQKDKRTKRLTDKRSNKQGKY